MVNHVHQCRCRYQLQGYTNEILLETFNAIFTEFFIVRKLLVIACSGLTLLVGRQEEYPSCKNE